LENYKQYKEEFEVCFKQLQKLTEDSFLLMEHNPEKKDEIVNMWKDNILKFISYTYKISEKYNNKDVIKTITKAFIFGK